MFTRHSRYICEIQTEIDENICLLGVKYFHYTPRNFSVRDSDLDYYGYTEVEFDVLNSNGEFWPEMDERVALDRGLWLSLSHEIEERLV